MFTLPSLPNPRPHLRRTAASTSLARYTEEAVCCCCCSDDDDLRNVDAQAANWSSTADIFNIFTIKTRSSSTWTSNATADGAYTCTPHLHVYRKMGHTVPPPGGGPCCSRVLKLAGGRACSGKCPSDRLPTTASAGRVKHTMPTSVADSSPACDKETSRCAYNEHVPRPPRACRWTRRQRWTS